MRIITSNSTRGAYRGVMDTLRRAAQSGGEHVIIVPDRFTASAERGVIESLNLRSSFNIQIISFMRLADRLAFAAGRNILTPEGSVMMLAKVIAESSRRLRFYSRSLSAAGFAEEFYAALTALRNSGISSASLRAAAADMPAGARNKAEDIADIYEGYLSALAEGYGDSVTRLEGLAEYLKTCKPIPVNYYVIDFYDFNMPELAVLEGLSKKALSLTVGVCLGNDNPNRRIYPDRILSRLCSLSEGMASVEWRPEQLNPVINTVSERLFSYEPAAQRTENNGKLELRCAPTQREEITAVACDIITAVKGGARFRDFEVVAGDLAEYSPEIKSVFGRYGIPFFIDKGEPLKEQTKIRYISAGLKCVSSGMRREAVLEFVKNPLFADSCGLDADCVFRFENFILKYNVDRGQFFKPFEFSEDVLYESAESTRRALTTALEPIDFRSAPAPRYADGVRKMSENAGNAWAQHVEKLTKLSPYYVKCAEQVDDKLNSVLDEISSVLDNRVDIAEFESILRSMLGSLRITLVPTYLDAVFIGDADSRYLGRGNIYIVGANSGKLPASRLGGAVISPKDEELFAALGMDVRPSLKEKMYLGMFSLTEIMKKTKGRLVISYPEAGPAGALRPSSVISELTGLIGENGKPLAIERITGCLPSVLGKQREDVLAALFSSPKACYYEILRNAVGDRALAENAPIYGAAYRFLTQDDKRRIERKFEIPERLSQTRSDGGHSLVTSVSRLERFFACPYAHFLKYTVGLKKRAEAEFEGTENGIIIHAVLAGLYKNIGAGLVNEENVESMAGSLFDRIIASEKKFAVLLTKPEEARMLAKLREESVTVCADLYRIYRRSRFKPVFIEAEIGGAEIKSPVYSRGASRVSLRGFIDRADVCGDRFIIVDYKTYRSADMSLAEIYYGEKIQAYIYAGAVAAHTGSKPAGVFYLPIYSGFTDDEGGRYKYRGQVTQDPKIASLIDSNFASDPQNSVLPYKFNAKTKEFAKDVHLTDDAFAMLTEYAGLIAAEGAEEISKGYIRPSALPDACRVCDFRSICAYADTEIRKKKRVALASFECCATGEKEAR